MTPRHRAPRLAPRWKDPAMNLAPVVAFIVTFVVMFLFLYDPDADASANVPEPVTYTPATCDDPEGIAHVPDNTDTIAYLNHGDPDVPAKGYWAAHEIDRLDDEDEGVVGVWPYDFSDVELECSDVDEAPDASEGDSERLVDGSDAELPNTGRES